MKPNYEKLTFGKTIETISSSANGSECHNYGIVNGCDEGCPALLGGRCEVPLEALKNCWFSREELSEIVEMYKLGEK